MTKTFEEESMELILPILNRERKKRKSKNLSIEEMQEAFNVSTGINDYLKYERYHPTRKNLAIKQRKAFIEALIEVSKRYPRAYVISFAEDLPDVDELERIVVRNKERGRLPK